MCAQVGDSKGTLIVSAPQKDPSFMFVTYWTEHLFPTLLFLKH